MHIAICDDESYFRKVLQEQLTIYSNEYGYDFVFYEYKDGLDLLASKLVFDLIFMDYQMRQINGIDTVGTLRKRPAFVDMYHESFHAEHCASIGLANYQKLPRLNKEVYVLNRIRQNAVFFNDAEILSNVHNVENVMNSR